MPQAVIQKLNKHEESSIKIALRYFRVIAACSDLHLTQTEIEVLAFTSVRGTITPLAAREEFIEMFKCSKGTIENAKSSLKKKGFMVKDENEMYRIPKGLTIDFNRHSTVILQVRLENTNEPKAGDDTSQ